MIHRQCVIEPGPRSDAAQCDIPRAVSQIDRHEDVVHRVQRLRVKNGTLQVIANSVVPLPSPK
jgi:hypothetical protein